MRTHLIRVLATSLALLFVVGVAHADRRTSLHGNQLIKDRDDTFNYPQLALSYNRSLSIDYGTAAGFGNALFIAGPDKNSAIGIALHRGDSVTPIGGGFYDGSVEPGMIFGSVAELEFPSQDNITAPTIADLIYAMRIGQNKLGFRLGFIGQGDTHSLNEDHQNTTSAFGFRLGAGYSMGKDGDFAFDASYLTGSRTAGEKEDDVEDASALTIHLGGRYYFAKSKGFKIGALVNTYFQQTGGTTFGTPDVENSTTRIAAMLGFGPVYRSKEKKYTVAMHAHLGFLNQSVEPNSKQDDDETSETRVFFPGFNVAMEYHLLSWLVFRSGASYNYLINASDSANKKEDSGNGDFNGERGGFSWNAGFGFLMENFRIDGTLSEGFMTSGPQFIGGNAPGLFGLVSATATF